MLLKACIFDLDGVIVDTAKYHYLAWKRLAKGLGFDFTEHDNERLKGVSRVDSLKILLSIGHVEKTDQEIEVLASIKNQWYVEYISQLTPNEILPGTYEFLRFLKSHDIPVAIGSSSKNARLILKCIGLESAFNSIVDGNRIAKAKPDPEVFTKAAEDLGVNYSECIVFEDAFTGIEAAKNAGMKSVGIGEPDILKQADLVVPSLDKLDYNKLFEL
jgi:beta-phosphoglucomutase